MATPPEQPWSNHEKNHLLAEIVKAANPSPDVLFNLIRNFNIKPEWEDIALPQGRTLRSSRAAFNDLWRTLPMQPMGAPPVPNTPLSANPTLKRPHSFEGPPYSVGPVPGGREIRPKPSSASAVYSQPSSSERPTKKKRGRPTKAEQQAKAEAVAASSMTSRETSYGLAPAPSTLRKQVQTSVTAPISSIVTMGAPAAVRAAPLAPTTRMPIAAMLTPTAREPKSASHSSSSSGNRRKARSTKSEAEEASPIARQATEYESPYTQVRRLPDDSPARTASLRHREGAMTESISRTPRSAPPQPSQPSPPPPLVGPSGTESSKSPDTPL